MPRRDWLGLSSLATMASALLFGLIGLLRLPKAAVLPSPSKKFRVELPQALAPGEAFIPSGRSVAIFRDAEGIYAISTVCTHLGCIVKATAEGFECPCHGSRFHGDGTVARGPAPRPLPWLKVSVNGASVLVDEGAVVPQGTKVS
jgi:Rieske Fe-S protein